MGNLELQVNLVRGRRFEEDPELATFFGEVAMAALDHDEDSHDEGQSKVPTPDRVRVTPFLDDDSQTSGYTVDSYVDLETGSWRVGHHRLVLREEEMRYGPGTYLALTDTGKQIGAVLGQRSPELLLLVDMTLVHMHEQKVLSPN